MMRTVARRSKTKSTFLHVGIVAFTLVMSSISIWKFISGQLMLMFGDTDIVWFLGIPLTVTWTFAVTWIVGAILSVFFRR